LQAPLQTPALHAGVVMLLLLQTTPQPPQFLVSVLVGGQVPLQQVWPVLQQAATLVPVQQLCPLVQQATAPPGAMQAVLPTLPQWSQALTQAMKAALWAGFVG
jgi:hypothetical protein